MSAAPSRRSPYMNMAKRVDDHVEQVVRTNFTAPRQQTPPCYDFNASIYGSGGTFWRKTKTGFLWDGRCEVYEMRDTGVFGHRFGGGFPADGGYWWVFVPQR